MCLAALYLSNMWMKRTTYLSSTCMVGLKRGNGRWTLLSIYVSRRVRVVATLLISGEQDRTFRQFSSVFYGLSSMFLHGLPHFGPTGRRVIHRGWLWLHPCDTVVKEALLYIWTPKPLPFHIITLHDQLHP